MNSYTTRENGSSEVRWHTNIVHLVSGIREVGRRFKREGTYVYLWLIHADVWHQIRSDQSISCVRLFATPWIAARQASLSITNSRSSLRLTSIASVMPSSRLILCHPLLLLPPIPPSIRVFSNESTLRMRWPKYWRFPCPKNRCTNSRESHKLHKIKNS